jgi:hypothetical protein
MLIYMVNMYLLPTLRLRLQWGKSPLVITSFARLEATLNGRNATTVLLTHTHTHNGVFLLHPSAGETRYDAVVRESRFPYSSWPYPNPNPNTPDLEEV